MIHLKNSYKNVKVFLLRIIKYKEIYGIMMDETKLAEIVAKIIRYHKDANVEKVIETAGAKSELATVFFII